MSRKECEKDICETFDQSIETDDKFESNLTKIYCEYVLSLDKIYVDRIVDGYYEVCENYLKEYSSNEKCEKSSNEECEKQFIRSYESKLARKGEEICKEIESYVNNELLVKKAVTYCHFISEQKNDNQDLVDRSQKYIEEVNDFYSYKNNFDRINNDRREREILSDMVNKRLKKI